MRMFYDEERDCVVSEKELKECYDEMIANNEIEMTFNEYVNDCKGKNGTLTEMFDDCFIEYKDYYIEFNFYHMNEASIQFCGDEIVFKTAREAMNFIDENE